MALMDWCGKPTDWYKECSKCKIGFWVEADNFDAARELMLEHFSPSCRPGEGLYSSCKSCCRNSDAGRKPNNIHREELLLSQHGRCAIPRCSKKISFRNKTACVDHVHATGKIRAILCFKCNTWMGAIDDRKWLAAAIIYRDSFR